MDKTAKETIIDVISLVVQARKDFEKHSNILKATAKLQIANRTVKRIITPFLIRKAKTSVNRNEIIVLGKLIREAFLKVASSRPKNIDENMTGLLEKLVMLRSVIKLMGLDHTIITNKVEYWIESFLPY